MAEATRIIAERGYLGFSLKELAHRCQLTNAGVLHYFPSKDDVLLALLQYRVSQDKAALAWLSREGKSPHDLTLPSVYNVLRSIMERSTTQPDIVRFYAVIRAEALHKNHPARKFFLLREAATLDIFEEMLAPHVRSARSKARQVAALMMGLEDQWLHEGQSFDLVKEWDRGAALLLPAMQIRQSRKTPTVA